MVNTDGLYFPCSPVNPFALVALDLGILVASHLGIPKAQTGYSRSILVLSCSWHRNGFRFGTRVKSVHTPINLGPGVGEHCNLDLFLDFTRPWLFGRIRAARWQRQGKGDYQWNEQSGRSSRVSKYFVYSCYHWLKLYKILKIILTIQFFFSGAGKNVFPLRTAAHTNIVRAQKCAI